MKYFLIGFIAFCSFLNAQDNPIQWKKEFKELGDDTYEVSLVADLAEGWHLYSPENTNEFIIPTVVKFMDHPSVNWKGEMKIEGDAKTIYSKAFSDDLIEYVSDVKYSRQFTVKNSKPFTIITEVEYQICNEKTCLAPQLVEFDIPVTPSKKAIAETPKKEDENTKETQEGEEDPSSQDEENSTAVVDEFTEDGAATPLNSDVKEDPNAASNRSSSGNSEMIISSIDVENPEYENCGESETKDKSLLILFGLGFLGGLLALLTPCVYPMIPLTVSYFTKSSDEQAGKSNAIIYALFILVIFVLISLPFHLFNVDSDIFNKISTSVYVNLFFFAVFVFFAFSFFGYYELTLPQKWMNKTDKLSRSGGIIGVFFMALTLVIVSFSCTGPILGGLLGSISGDNGPTKLTSAFGGFGLSWALIFGLLALFPSMLKSLPKSGGWLNTTKVVLGFIELALALKFLSKADLVSKTFMIKREIFVILWIVISILTVLYLLGFIRFPHDERPNKMTWGKRFLALVFGGFALYLLPGLFPNHNEPNLKLLSGLTPPMTVSYFADDECPLGLDCTHDYFDAIELAKQENKPVLIDFTGWGCENCRKMEEFVWSDPEVLEILSEDVILASLYVDDKEPLDKPYTIELQDGSRRKIKSVGNQWSVFQYENFKEQTQPQYVLVTPDQKVLNYPVGGYMEKEKFLNFLKCGIDNFHANQ